jgi:hypothetical protein
MGVWLMAIKKKLLSVPFHFCKVVFFYDFNSMFRVPGREGRGAPSGSWRRKWRKRRRGWRARDSHHASE